MPAAVVAAGGTGVGVAEGVLDILQGRAETQGLGSEEWRRLCGVAPAGSPADRQRRPSCSWASL